MPRCDDIVLLCCVVIIHLDVFHGRLCFELCIYSLLVSKRKVEWGGGGMGKSFLLCGGEGHSGSDDLMYSSLLVFCIQSIQTALTWSSIKYVVVARGRWA